MPNLQDMSKDELLTKLAYVNKMIREAWKISTKSRPDERWQPEFEFREELEKKVSEQEVRDEEYKRLSALAYDGFGTANWHAQEPEEHGDFDNEGE